MSDAAAIAAADPPPGFVYVSRAAFVNHVGPIFQADSDPPGKVRLGLRIADVHTNTMGFLHGGMLATVADSAMARALFSKLKRRSVTLRMTVDYLDAVRIGDWLELAAELAFDDGEFGHTAFTASAGGELKARGEAVFRLLKAV